MGILLEYFVFLLKYDQDRLKNFTMPLISFVINDELILIVIKIVIYLFLYEFDNVIVRIYFDFTFYYIY